MLLALEQARLSVSQGEVPVGAVIARRGEVVSTGRNRRENDKNALAHAELEAIDKACKALGGWRLWECELFVTLEPCVMCAGAAFWTQIGKVVYGAEDEKRGYSLVSSGLMHPATEVRGGVLREECRSIMKKFFLGKR